jgi:hypothetical protein
MMRPSDAALFQRAPILRGSLALVKTTMELEMRTMIHWPGIQVTCLGNFGPLTTFEDGSRCGEPGQRCLV